VTRAIFLDRDGVINEERGYVGLRKDFHFISNIDKVLLESERRGYLRIVVTNQSGIASKRFSTRDFLTLTNWMSRELQLKGASVTAVYWAPYANSEDAGEHPMRKPNPGMILRAAKDFDISLGESVMIGDQLSDLLAARRAGVGRFILFGDSGIVAPGMDYMVATSHREVLSCLGWNTG